MNNGRIDGLREHPYVDFTMLKDNPNDWEIRNFCRQARERPDLVRAVCVRPNPEIIRQCLEYLDGTKIGICTVIDYPHGNGGLEVKLREASAVHKLGVREVDVVINLSALVRGDYQAVREEINLLAAIGRVSGEPLRIKAIMEVSLSWYTRKRIRRTARLLRKAGAWCLKSSTGIKSPNDDFNIETPAGIVRALSLTEKAKQMCLAHQAAHRAEIKIAGGIRCSQDVDDILHCFPNTLPFIGTSSPFWRHTMSD